MISIAVISESPALKQCLEHLALFLSWDCQITLEDLRDSYAYLDKEIIICGHPERKIAVREIMAKLRRKNPFTPVIFLAPELSDTDLQQSHNLRPVSICKWPYSSFDLVTQVESGMENSGKVRSAEEMEKDLEQALEDGQSQKALACLEAMRDMVPEYPYSILAARCNLSGKNFDAALAAANNAVNLEPELPDSIEILAIVQNAMGNREQSLGTLEQHGDMASKDTGLLILKADTLLEDGQFSRAKENYTQALGLDPRNEIAKKGKFLAGVMDGSITSITSGKGATQTSIELAKLCNNKAISFVRAKEFEVAETLYQNTIRILPDKRLEYKLWMNLGLCMKKAHNWAKALEYFKKGKANAPEAYRRFEDQIAAMERMLESLK